MSTPSNAVLTELDEAECLRLISPGGIGRIAFVGRYDLTVLPVNYRLVNGAVLFRMSRDSVTGEDLRTGMVGADYKVAFEIDEFDQEARTGWSVLVQGPAHHLESEAERTAASTAGVEPWPGGEKDHFIRITPTRITGRRVSRAA